MRARHRALQRSFAVGTALTLGMGGALIASPAFADDSQGTAPVTGAAYEDQAKSLLAEEGVAAVGHDGNGNLVVVKVTGSETAEVDELDADNSNIVIKEISAPLEAAATDDVVGGAGFLIQTPGSLGACSVGFSAWTPAGDPALITAGHCAVEHDATLDLSLPSQDPAVGGPGGVPAGNGIIGTYGFSQYGGPGNTPGADGDRSSIDIAVIDVTNDELTLLPEVTDWTTASSDDLAASTVDVTSLGTATVGATVTKSGRTSGESSAEVTMVDGWGNVSGHFVHGFGANLGVLEGDSGGAVIQGNAAVGVVSGGNFTTGFSWIADLENAITYTDGYTVMLHIDAPAVTSPAADAEVTPGTAISGTAPAGTTLVVTPESGAPFDVTVSADGNWTFPAPADLGAYSFSALAKSGFDESDSVSHSVTVVAAPIAAPVISSPADGARVVDGVDEITGTGIPGATVTVTGDVTGTATVAADGTWTVAADLSYGSYSISVEQATPDQTSPAAEASFDVVLATPVIVSPADGSEFADGEAPTVVSGTGVDGATVTISVNGEAAGTVEVVDGVWEFSLEGLTNTGENTITATQNVGDVVSAVATSTFTVAAPAAPEPPAPGGEGEGGDDDGLATTGGGDLTPFAAVGALLFMIGGGLYMVSRRRASAVRTNA